MKTVVKVSTEGCLLPSQQRSMFVVLWHFISWCGRFGCCINAVRRHLKARNQSRQLRVEPDERGELDGSFRRSWCIMFKV